MISPQNHLPQQGSQQPKATQPHIGIFGRRNTGKSSLLNYLLGYELALVSEIAGTTTDSVEKSVEIPPLGPVVLIDTAGIDDEGTLGALRIKNTLARLASVDLALLVTDGEWGKYEEQACSLFNEHRIPFIVVCSKADLGGDNWPLKKELIDKRGFSIVAVSAFKKQGLDDLILAILAKLPEQALNPPPMLGDLVPAGAVCLFVAPIDQSAPKARLIAPQVQALRDCLDGHAISIIVQPEELEAALGALRKPPHLLVCDSQAVHQCVQIAPASLPLTTYSILMARLKGDLAVLAAGAAAIHGLKDGDMVCISEVCTHHAQPDDIGRVKIPQLLAKFTGKKLDIRFAAGKDYPEDIGNYKLIIHCGGCMINRATMLARLAAAARADIGAPPGVVSLKGVPITNYGVAISLMHGVLERSLQIFPHALNAYTQALKNN